METVPDKSHRRFLALFSESLDQIETLLGLTLSKPQPQVQTNQDLVRLECRPVVLAGNYHISVNFHYERRDETKNFLPSAFISELEKWLEQQFLFADLRCVGVTHSLRVDRKGKGHLVSRRIAPTTAIITPSEGHNRVKHRRISPTEPWLALLGISDGQGQILPRMQDKYRQIDKFAEIIEDYIADWQKTDIAVVDMGCGKAYLTFALYDLLCRWGQSSATRPKVCGVELRADLVKKCNAYAAQSGFSGLEFSVGSIETWQSSPTPGFNQPDILVALHACDTATDDALLAGIRGQSRLILVSPCCHKQVRAAMKTSGLSTRITRFGILEERLAEILTDSIRALVLEANGYKVKVFEFISTEHTGKNLMIAAEKLAGEISESTRRTKLAEAADLMAHYGVARHYLLENLTGRPSGNQA